MSPNECGPIKSGLAELLDRGGATVTRCRSTMAVLPVGCVLLEPASDCAACAWAVGAGRATGTTSSEDSARGRREIATTSTPQTTATPSEMPRVTRKFRRVSSDTPSY